MQTIRNSLLILFSLAFLPSVAMSQIAVQYDTVSVWLSGAEVDTIIVHFPNRPNSVLTFDTTGTGTSKITQVGQRGFIPFYMSMIIDTVEATASADVDSFAVSWVPLNPYSKAFLTAHQSYIIGTASVAVAAYSEVTQYDLPITSYSTDYALIVRQDDLGTPRLRLIITFVRIM